MNTTTRKRLRFFSNTNLEDFRWYLLPTVIITSDDWRYEWGVTFRWVRWRLHFQWYIA